MSTMQLYNQKDLDVLYEIGVPTCKASIAADGMNDLLDYIASNGPYNENIVILMLVIDKVAEQHQTNCTQALAQISDVIDDIDNPAVLDYLKGQIEGAQDALKTFTHARNVAQDVFDQIKRQSN